jgi:hypothetical protein
VVNILSPSTEFNWALFQPIVGTGVADGGNVVSNLVDDNTNTRWSVNGFPESATVDLHGNITITRTEVTCYENRAYQFIIEGALEENGPYTTIVDRSNNSSPGTPITPIINVVDSVVARFVRITVSGADVYTGPWTSLTELRVFGDGERDPLLDVSDELQDLIKLSPNPANSIVTIQGAEDYNSLSVYDQSGRKVIQRNNFNLRTLDISELRSGIYFVRFEGNNKPYVTKLIKI